MAEADLDDFETSSDDLTNQFHKAADHLKNLLSKIDSNTLLTLYGYYKQGTEGPCNIPKPSWYDTKAKAKWSSWEKLRDLSSLEAKLKYVELVQNIDPNYSTEISTKGSGWASVSTLQSTNEPILNDSDKSLVDFVKEGNLNEVVNILKLYNHNKTREIINKLDADGLSLIHWAADRGSADILDVIIAHGANVNLLDIDSQTALHYASSCGHIDCVSILLKNGADLSLKDADGLDPRAAANDDLVRKLLDSYS